jgi:REP element-mobilizing transposase RayT
MHRRLHRLDRVFLTHPVYFVTTCTQDRRPLLARDAVSRILIAEWQQTRSRHGWGIGRYVIMPDHVHFFAAEMPVAGTDGQVRSLSDFIGRWKEWTAKAVVRAGIATAPVWQEGFFDHMLRDGESYAEKWSYVRANPVRKNLARQPEDWPYQGYVDFDSPLG